MAPKTVHQMELETLMEINREVVALTGEPHGYAPADKEKLEALMGEVEQRADNQDLQEAVPEKAALLVFKVASGQYFRAGNKRTALVAGLVFLAKNGYTMDITSPEFVSMVDRAGMGAAGLDDLYGAMQGLVAKSKTDRSGWEKVVARNVESLKDFLTKQGA